MKKTMLILSAMLLLSSCAQENNSEITETKSTEETAATETSAEVFDPAVKNTDYEYDISYSGNVNIKKYLGSETIVTVPEEIEGCPVIAYSPYAFEDTDVTTITFPSGLQKFSGVRSAHYLETVNITSDIVSITVGQIIDCENLQNVNISDSSKFTSKDGIVFSADGKTLVYFPMGRSGEFTVPDGIEMIGENAFNRTSLTSVILSNDVREIGHRAFWFSELEKISFNEGLKSIGARVFDETSVREFYLPDSIEKCGIFWTDGCEISAPLSAIENKDMEILLLCDNAKVEYRGETDLQRLFRKAGGLEKLAEYRIGRIFIDLDGDSFPEMAVVSKSGYVDWYRFDIATGSWGGIPLYVSSNTDLNLYYDKDRDEYLYIYSGLGEYAYPYSVDKLYITKDGFERNDRYYDYYNYYDYFGFLDSYSAWHYDEESKEYITEAYVDFGYLNGKYYIAENDPDFFSNAMKEALSDYELINSVNVQKIIEEQVSGEERFEIFIGDFADSPQPSVYKKAFREDTEEKNDFITIGDRELPINAQSVWINCEDASEENFEKLSAMPYLTTLSIYNRYDSDIKTVNLSGIDKLSGLGELNVYGSVINAAEIGKLDNLRVLWMSAEADDLDFLTNMDDLMVIYFDDTMDKPDDFFKPLYGMKNLRYLLVSTFERSMTDEQEAHIRENAPQINICKFKRG